MSKYVLFGAGFYGKVAINHLGQNSIEYILDNNPDREGQELLGIPIYYFPNKVEECKKKEVVISVRQEICSEIANQLKESGIAKYKTMYEVEQEMVQDRIKESSNNIVTYKKAINWIKTNTFEGKGIINTSTIPLSYPEVTGYYIPTLLDWGYRDLAIQYAKWLCNIQNKDGSWTDTEGTGAFVFDSGQILKGLVAIYPILPEVKTNLIKGCDWLVSNMTEEGRLPAVDPSTWQDGKTLSELVHIYCLSPLCDVGKLLDRPDYIEKAHKILNYYINNYKEKILDFHLLSHFYAYVIEGLIDMGEINLAKEAMDKVALLQTPSGAVPGYKNVNWVCSTGLFQFAIIWFKLGDLARGEKAFNYACKLQNETGGWYGSYQPEQGACENMTYIPDAEISWAVKYFLDALKFYGQTISKMRCEFFVGEISNESTAYETLKNTVKDVTNNQKQPMILDVGCGKGVQAKQLKMDFPKIDMHAVDIIEDTISCIPDAVATCKVGSLTSIPYKNETFDMVYTCEALEHAVDIENAIKELARATKKDGTILIIDKYLEARSEYLIEKWEQFFDEDELKSLLEKYCDEVRVIHGIGHYKDEYKMSAWIGKKHY